MDNANRMYPRERKNSKKKRKKERKKTREKEQHTHREQGRRQEGRRKQTERERNVTAMMKSVCMFAIVAATLAGRAKSQPKCGTGKYDFSSLKGQSFKTLETGVQDPPAYYLSVCGSSNETCVDDPFGVEQGVSCWHILFYCFAQLWISSYTKFDVGMHVPFVFDEMQMG